MLSEGNINVSEVNSRNQFIENLRTNTSNGQNMNNENYQSLDRTRRQSNLDEREK